MQIRDNVRRRRRERIETLLGQRPEDAEENRRERGAPVHSLSSSDPQAAPEPPETEPETETDPEKWWKEHERRQRAHAPNGSAAGPLTALRPTAHRAPVPPEPVVSPFAKGFAIRLTVAAVIFGLTWGWFSSGLPGNRDARQWTIAAITRDMDFQAVEVWYERTFGGSPAFLPIFRSTGESQAVSGTWHRQDAVLPVAGRIVRTFEQDGSGVRIAATEGSPVKAVYAGRILQVSTESDGKSTVLVQHTGRMVTVYGNLDTPAVKAGDWAEAGQRLGVVPAPLDDGGESLLFFAVKRNGKTLDPVEVVPFD